MAKTNNGYWKIIITVVGLAGTLISIGIIYATLSGGVDWNSREITAIKPQVQLNTEYRLTAEVDTRYIKEKISNIEIMQKQILEEVRK